MAKTALHVVMTVAAIASVAAAPHADGVTTAADPRALALLDQTIETYKGFTSYTVDCHASTIDPGSDRKNSAARVSYRAPGSYPVSVKEGSGLTDGTSVYVLAAPNSSRVCTGTFESAPLLRTTLSRM